MFINSKRRLHTQNQDLIKTFNSLTYDNKYFRNVMKTYENNLDEDDKHFIFNNPSNSKQFNQGFSNITYDNTNTSNTSNNLKKSNRSNGF